jgi:hypothetical protein
MQMTWSNVTGCQKQHRIRVASKQIRVVNGLADRSRTRTPLHGFDRQRFQGKRDGQNPT